MRYQLIFCFHWGYKKYVRRMANQFAEFFTFGFFDLLVLIPVVYSSVILTNLPHFSTTVMKMWLLVFKLCLYYEVNSSNLINSNSPLNLQKCYGFVMISGWIEVIFTYIRSEIWRHSSNWNLPPSPYCKESQ